MGVGAICEYDPATAFFIALVFFNVFALGRTLRFRSVFLNMSVTSLSVLFSTLSIKPEVCEGFVRKKADQPRYQREPERNLTESIVRLGAGYEFELQ